MGAKRQGRPNPLPSREREFFDFLRVHQYSIISVFMACKNYAYYPNLLRGYAFFNKPLFVLDDPRHSIAEKRWTAFGTTDTGGKPRPRRERKQDWKNWPKLRKKQRSLLID